MIISASYRTDLPAFHGAWFARRLAAGFAAVRNPYNNRLHPVALTPQSVSGLVFWTRDIAPFWQYLDLLDDFGRPAMFQYSVLGYPRLLDRAVPAAEHGVTLIRRLADRFGKRAVVWRYDPVLITDLTPADWHRAQFADLLCKLRGSVDEVVVSHAQIYAKARRRLDMLTREHGLIWHDPPAAEKIALLADLAGMADAAGLRFSLCSQPDLLGPGMAAARCIDAARLSDLAGRPVVATTRGNRPGCACAESRDIGAYDSCAHGCAYCYAVGTPARLTMSLPDD